MPREIKNAIIRGAKLGYADRGLLTVWVELDYGGTQQGFGGFALYLPKSFTNHKVPSHAGHYIFRVLEVAGVDDWDRLIGKTVRADCDHGCVYGIGHIVKDDWFYPKKDFAESSEVPA